MVNDPADRQGEGFSATVRDAYLTLVEDVLLDEFAAKGDLAPIVLASRKRKMLARLLAIRGMAIGQPIGGPRDAGIPRRALTMIGRTRLRSIRFCLESVLNNNVPGDVIETGVWRGGASIYARAVLKAWDVSDRQVWVADSFEGLPPRDLVNYPADHTAFGLDPIAKLLAVSVEQVQANFERLHLLDDQVRFVKGWFKDTLPGLSAERWAVLRLDGDFYESTIQALDSLYPNLSPGGWVIIDDYYPLDACREAVTDYRAKHGIRAEIAPIDADAVMWQHV
jgi:O-methyltransferase